MLGANYFGQAYFGQSFQFVNFFIRVFHGSTIGLTGFFRNTKREA